jgi:hypothetical protein
VKLKGSHTCRKPDRGLSKKAGASRRVEGGYSGPILDLTAREAVNTVDRNAGRDLDECELQSRAEALLERLPSIPEDAFLEVWI